MNTLLIDIDNTLLNFTQGEVVAFRGLLEDLKIEYTEDLFENYLSINSKLWEDYEEGIIDKDAIVNNRFPRSLEKYDVIQSYTGLELDDMFRSHLEANTIFMENAYEMLTELKNDYRLVVVTNGIQSTQHKRLKNAGILDFFDLVVVSSETGSSKPHLPFFNYVFDRLDNVDKNKTIILGDSLSADIKGGLNAGIQTCWYNPRNLSNHTDIKPDYVIDDLKDFVSLVKEENK